MDVSFYKLHSTGGDYIVTNFLHSPTPDVAVFPRVASHICKRRTGVGANGLIVLTQGVEHALKASFFLPTGEQRPLPGDAVACMGRFAFDSGLADNSRISCESDYGVVTADVIDSANFRIDFGIPREIATDKKIIPTSEINLNRTVSVDGKRLPFTPVRLISDYAVFSTSKRPSAAKKLAATLSEHEGLSLLQPVFMRMISDQEISAYTWTVAGKTPDHAGSVGACVTAGILNGFCEAEVTVRFRSFLLFVQWLEHDGRVLVTAPSEYICSGSYYIEPE
jgi:diaminopimelate epimerase